MNHILLTRVNFGDKELMAKYLEVTKSILIPSLKNQTNKKFVWAIYTNKNDIDFLKNELDYDFLPFTSMEDYKKYVKLENIEIQTRHDCDDYMSEDYIDKIQNIFYSKKKDNDDVNCIIHFQPTKFDFISKKEYKMGRYHDKRNSMFLSLCQSNNKNGIFDEKHGDMYKITQDITLVDEGYVKLVIHGNNKLSTLNKNDIEI